jgi:uncharacterized protein (TIGR02217 family)
MAFHKIRFPLDIALNSRGGPERLTDIATLTSGHEERNQRWAHARRRYNAGYGIKSREDVLAVVTFFEERRGRFHSFLWRDGLDYSSNGGAGVPTTLDQQIGIGDGTMVAFQLVKRYGAAFDPYDRPITKPDAATVRVAVNGVAVSGGDFTVDDTTGIVTLTASPAPGAVVTAGFLFDVPVRFDTDRLDVDLSGFDAAEVSNIPLIEVRR